ncbi:TPA: hypothetical protein ACH3X1_006827 [Trebouxia sp. C0004]
MIGTSDWLRLEKACKISLSCLQSVRQPMPLDTSTIPVLSTVYTWLSSVAHCSWPSCWGQRVAMANRVCTHCGSVAILCPHCYERHYCLDAGTQANKKYLFKQAQANKKHLFNLNGSFHCIVHYHI